MISNRTESAPNRGFRRFYGAHPLHLLLMLAGFALLGYVIVTAKLSTLWRPDGPWWHSMAVWFLAAFLVHDLVLFPLYALADRVLAMRPARRSESKVPVINHIRVPALGSALMFAIFFPGIVRQGATLYFEDTGLTQEPFLGRWLMLTAILFAGSALVFGIRRLLAGRGR